MEDMIKFENICYKSGSRYLLHNINWTLYPGEHWILFGVNGSGKTTLLSILAGFNHYSSGKMQILGEEYSAYNILEIRSKIGWVSNSFFDKYYTMETPLTIVLSGLTGTLGVSRFMTDDKIKRAITLLKRLQLSDKIDQPFSYMSKGERQKVLIARALINSPEILILDEPCTGLDVYARELTLNIIDQLAKTTKMTIIYVTHYLEEILPVFNKTLLLKSGKIFTQGNTIDIVNSNIFSAYLECPTEIYSDKGKYNLVFC